MTLCAKEALEGRLPGNFLPYIATSTFDPSVDFTQSQVPYRRVDFVQIASNWGDLVDGSLAAPLNLDAQGATFNNVEVWTGSGCDDYSNTSGLGPVGVNSFTDSRWTDSYVQTCDRTNVHLYCMQQ